MCRYSRFQKRDSLPFCACGCGKKVRSFRVKYLRGHNSKGRRQVEIDIMYTSGRTNELLPLKELAKGISYSHRYLSLRARQGALNAIKIEKTWYSFKHSIVQYLNSINSK